LTIISKITICYYTVSIKLTQNINPHQIPYTTWTNPRDHLFGFKIVCIKPCIILKLLSNEKNLFSLPYI
jgi:hypothetical protein